MAGRRWMCVVLIAAVAAAAGLPPPLPAPLSAAQPGSQAVAAGEDRPDAVVLPRRGEAEWSAQPGRKVDLLPFAAGVSDAAARSAPLTDEASGELSPARRAANVSLLALHCLLTV